MLLGILLGSTAFACAAAPPEANVTQRIELEIPPAVAERAAQSAAGVAGVAPPVVVIAGLEIDPQQGLSLEVRGAAAEGEAAPVLAFAGAVGNPSGPAGPRQLSTLVIPLNRRGQQLIAEAQRAGRRQLRLELAAEGGQPLVFSRIYFQNEAAAPSPPP